MIQSSTETTGFCDAREIPSPEDVRTKPPNGDTGSSDLLMG